LTQEKRGRLFKNEYVETIVMIAVIVGVVLGFWYGSQFVLNTQNPALAVASQSMSVGLHLDGYNYPFSKTLQVGDLIIIQGIKPEDIYAAPFNESGRSGDILVFRAGDTLIVHRAVGTVMENGTIVAFVTKGDGNPGPGPGSPTPVGNVIGKVIMRIPWVGYLALYMRDTWGVYTIVAVIVLLIVIEFLIPEFRDKKKPEKKPEGF
jgi:signal peptidase